MSTSVAVEVRDGPRPRQAERCRQASAAEVRPVRQTAHEPLAGCPLWISSPDICSTRLAARGRTRRSRVHVNAHHESDAGLDTLDHRRVAEVSTAPAEELPSAGAAGGGEPARRRRSAASAQQGASTSALRAESTGPPQRTWRAVGEHQPYVVGGARRHRASRARSARGQVGRPRRRSARQGVAGRQSARAARRARH